MERPLPASSSPSLFPSASRQSTSATQPAAGLPYRPTTADRASSNNTATQRPDTAHTYVVSPPASGSSGAQFHEPPPLVIATPGPPFPRARSHRPSSRPASMHFPVETSGSMPSGYLSHHGSGQASPTLSSAGPAHGAWSVDETERLKALAEESRTRFPTGEIDWDWTVDTFGETRSR